MDRSTFERHLREATQATLNFAEELCWNHFPDKVDYLIQPNALDENNHLDQPEKENLSRRKKELGKKWTRSEVLDRLCFEDRVPAWINVSVGRVTRSVTTIALLTSRRFRKESDLYHANGGFPPFHVAIPISPYREEGKKFDVNWNRPWKWRWYVWKWRWHNRKWPG